MADEDEIRGQAFLDEGFELAWQIHQTMLEGKPVMVVLIALGKLAGIAFAQAGTQRKDVLSWANVIDNERRACATTPTGPTQH